MCVCVNIQSYKHEHYPVAVHIKQYITNRAKEKEYPIFFSKCKELKCKHMEGIGPSCCYLNYKMTVNVVIVVVVGIIATKKSICA